MVGPLRDDGKHELVTLYQRVALSDRIAVERSAELRVAGFRDDTLVRRALECVAGDNGSTFSAHVTKRIPVAAGLGGGSSDAATALHLANALRNEPYDDERLYAFARELGADVPYFLADGPQLGTGDGTQLTPVELPQDYWIVLVLPRSAAKRSTASVYGSFDELQGERGYDRRRAELLGALDSIERPRDLAALPPNDLASSPVAKELEELGAFRADVTGAGPAVYGLFLHAAQARAAQREMSPVGRTWITAPAWYR
ncbi:MAG: 4-diphosphocytidyl-2-C-methyl-D-erythritol kinase [Gaiellaceae bacterium]|nr:4-diphosphocytidyl-2-C-methyl-D-erythritol kinase [Gaiellaceae bacterium]MDX6512867.1 4-diphosphocytidyl-2-C-methyl-D-erythritol kinase [Gaiellaceae bacterium]